MRANARRLARRYLPQDVRNALLDLRDRRAAKSVAPTKGRAGGKARKSRHEPVVEALRTGGALADAVVVQVRALLDADEVDAAASIAASLRKEPDTATIGALASGIVAFRRGYVALAAADFSTVPQRLWAAHAAEEYVRCGLALDQKAALAEVQQLVDDDPDYVDARGWMGILGPVYGVGDEALARDVFGVLDKAVGDGTDVDAGLTVTRDWMRRWVEASDDSRSAAAAAPGHVSFAIMDYGHPGRGRASANIGDHIQSLASLGHVVRHQQVTFHGPQELVDLMQQLHSRVRPELQLTDVQVDLDVLTVDRDASTYSEVAPNTWTLAFGWFMHSIFEMRYDFPFHRNLLPIFLSFHCNKRDLLTPEAVEYLRRFGPIGCRDWTTVDILLSLEVPAFFSGCMTTTVNTVFPDLPERPARSAPVAYIDMPPAKVPAGAATYKHSNDAIRFRTFAANLYKAIDLLETYRRDYSGLVTSRLHGYLPGRSIGMSVDFQPKNRADIRFAGLIDITDDEFDRMRDGINDKVAQVMTRILSGDDPDSVYALWRTLTAADVEAAKARHAAPAQRRPLHAGVARDVERAVAATRTLPTAASGSPDVVHVVTHVSADEAVALDPLVASLVRHASRPLHVWVISRTPDVVDLDGLHRRHPGTTFSVVPTKSLGADLRRADARPTVPKDLDLLVVGDLLANVDRAVLVPVDSIVTTDIAPLYDLDLSGDLLAAPTVVGSNGTSGFGAIHSAGNRLGRKTVAANELRRQAHARHAYDFDAFTCDVLVLDLAQSRAAGFVDEYLPYVEEFGLTRRELLFFAVGPHRAVVPEEWDAVPTRSVVPEPKLIHWADAVKPWDDGYTADQEQWLAAATSH